YNVEPYLKQCLDSVIHQTYQNLQIILVDDGSTDQSFEIAYEYFQKDQRISIIQKPNGGLSQARNVGMDYLMSLTPPPTDYTVYAHSKPFAPDYIHFLDSDDWFELDCIEKCAEIFASHPQVDIVWHEHSWFLEEIQKKDTTSIWPKIKLLKGYAYPPEQIFAQMCTRHFNFAWQGAFRSEFAHQVRFIEGIEFEDVAYGMMLFSCAKLIYLSDQRLMCYRIRPNSICQRTLTKDPNLIPTYAPYMQVLIDAFGGDFKKAKFYSFFYADCINIIKTHQWILEKEIEEENPALASELRSFLAFRALVFIFSRKHWFGSIDPYKTQEMCDQIQSYGYKPNALRIQIQILLHKFEGFNIRVFLREKIPFIYIPLRSIKRLIYSLFVSDRIRS
ncbi:glycosyltransferase, partial [Helicobacter pametensis]